MEEQLKNTSSVTFRVARDMTGRTLNVPAPPQRIVSLVPSQTELLYDLGLEEEVVGATKFCVHPGHWFRNKTRVGGTKDVHLDRIEALQPDLILANKEENVREQIEALAASYPVWVSDVRTVTQALEMIREVGMLTGRAEKANELTERIDAGFARLTGIARPKRVAYLIWRKPWMSIGRDTFIHDVLTRLGWEHVFADRERYPSFTAEELAARKPDLILLSSEPFPFGEKHIAELKAVAPKAEVRLADGEMFSWYGSRMLKAADYLADFCRAI
mgnify:CR=1 FL=1